MATVADPLSYDELVGDDVVGGGSAPGRGPAVVLLHPSGFGPRLVRPFAQRLAIDHRTSRVVVPHRRGYERSASLPPITALDDHHDDLLALLTSLDIDRPVLVGVSAGASLALGFTIRHPDAVGGVVVHEPLLGPLGGALHAIVSERIEELLVTADQPHHAGIFMSTLVGRAEWNGLREDWRLAVDTNADVVRNEARLFASFAVTDDQLQALPATFVATTGARSPEARAEVAAVLARHGVATRTLPDTRHLPVIENPTAFAATVSDVVDATRHRIEGANA